MTWRNRKNKKVQFKCCFWVFTPESSMFYSLFTFHFMSEHQNSDHIHRCSIGQHPPKFRHDLSVFPCKGISPRIHCVQKRQALCQFSEYTANHGRIKPGPGQPCAQVGEQSAAGASHLFIIEHTAAQQANEQLANGEITQQQYDVLQREIVETEQNLRSLQDQAATTNATLAKIDEAGEKLQSI